MKNFSKNLIIGLAHLLLVWSCSGGGENPVPEPPKAPVTIPTEFNNISLDETPEPKEVRFTATVAWSVELSETKAIPEWVEVSPMSGGAGSVTLVVNAQQNTTFEQRKASITINAGGEKYQMHLTQSGKTRTFALERAAHEFKNNADTTTLKVTSNANWQTGGVPAWLTLTPSSGEGDTTVEIICQANSEIEKRSATVTFTSGNLTEQLSITQQGEPAVLSIDRALIEIGKSAETIAINVSSNTLWAASGVPAWVTLTPANGEGDATVQVAIQENTSTSAREATITFTAGGITQELRITQAAFIPTLSIDKTAITVSQGQSTTTIALTSNTLWATSGVPAWVTLTPANGEGDATVQVAIQENTSSSAREATITFIAGGLSKTLNIKQLKSQIEDLTPEEL